MISLLFAINNGADWGWTSLPVLTGLGLASCSLPHLDLSKARSGIP